MCCNGRLLTSSDTPSDYFDEQLVASPLPDGYWLAAFPFSDKAKLPDLVGYGLGFTGKPAAIKLFLNPGNTTLVKTLRFHLSSTDLNNLEQSCSPAGESWKILEIQSLDFPVAMIYADLTGDGFNDS